MGPLRIADPPAGSLGDLFRPADDLQSEIQISFSLFVRPIFSKPLLELA